MQVQHPTEMPVPPFGAVQYIGDFTTNAHGTGHVRVDAIIDEAFAFNNITGVRTDLNHVVFWFADPADDEDCVPGSPPAPFDGDGEAGVAAMSSKNFLPGAPLPNNGLPGKGESAYSSFLCRPGRRLD